MDLCIQACALRRQLGFGRLRDYINQYQDLELKGVSKHNQAKIAACVEKWLSRHETVQRVVPTLRNIERVESTLVDTLQSDGDETSELSIAGEDKSTISFVESVVESVVASVEDRKKEGEKHVRQESSTNLEERRVTFEGETAVFEIPENLLSFRAIPRRWKDLLARTPSISHWRREFSRWFRGFRPLIVEICCEEESGMCVVCRKLQLPYIGVTKTKGLNGAPKQVLRWVTGCQRHSAWWISTPCTAGCRLRHLNLHNEKHLETWQERFLEHKEIWRAIRDIFGKSWKTKQNVLISHEWPVNCDLFQDVLYQDVSKLLCLQFQAKVNRCCLDGIRKEWVVHTNSEMFSSRVSTGTCSCVEKQDPKSLKESGHYSQEVALHLL